jgi:hypothetical protein
MASPLERSLATIHRFEFTPVFRAAALPFGILPRTCRVELLGPHLIVSFGPWNISTPLDNIDGAEVTGPYGWLKVIGPPHLSLADSGLTFATNPTAGACLRFREPVPGIEPFGRVKHPALTVTVAEPDQLVADISDATAHVDDLERDERAVLEARTAAELRTLASDLGIAKVSSMKKAELIERILSNDELAGEALDHEVAGGPG